jgi:hypothetical protein
MPELRNQTNVRQTTELPVSEIFRLAERFRHMAKDLSEVFIQASRQAIIYRVETDPEEERTLSLLHQVKSLGQRLRQRIARATYRAPQLVKKAAPETRTQTPLQRQVDTVRTATKTQTPRPIQPKPEQAVSLLEAASKLKKQLGVEDAQVHSQTTAGSASAKPSALSLSAEELPKYKKYRDLAEQFLAAKQFPHFKTLLNKAAEDLSPQALEILREFGREKGCEA